MERHRLAEAEVEVRCLRAEAENLQKAEETLRKALLCTSQMAKSTHK